MSPEEPFLHVTGSPRRLAAIVAADIAGYSRLMGADEEGTLARIKRHRRELIDPTIAEHQGRLIKNTGDGFLAMFDSPLEAVRCAIVIQQSMKGRNASLPRQQWIQYRIGINLGDVIVDPDDIYGDGVNIAARLESLAEPGSVYISGGVYEQIKNKLVCGYQSLGDEKLKNITDPVRIYRVLPDPEAVTRAKRSRWIGLGAWPALAVLAAMAGWYVWRGTDPLETLKQRTSAALHLISPRAAPPQATGSLRDLSLPAPPPTPAEPPFIPPPPEAPAAAPAQPAREAAIEPQTLVPPVPGTRATVRDCTACPEMVALAGGVFLMGSSEEPTEKPVHQVTVAPFLIGRFPVTVGEWKACVAARACSYVPSGSDDSPVRNISWNDAQQYVQWLSKVTQKNYRIPSEAEWEYAARAGSETKFWWGNQVVAGMANCRGCGDPYDPQQPARIGTFAANPFGLYEMAGGVAEWVADCWHRDYQGAPRDGSARDEPNCGQRVLRGGSWKNDPSYLRSASRDHYDADVRYITHGLRVARSQ